MSDVAKKKHHLTQAEKDRAVFLTSQGAEALEIGRELGVDARQISGFIRSQINMGKIPPIPPKNSPSLETPMQTPPPFHPESPMSGPSAVPSAQPAPAPTFAPTPPYSQPVPHASYPPPPPAHVEPSDGWTEGRPVIGHSDGFTNNAQQVRTVVEREIPADGILGEIMGPVTKTQLCEMYGEGSYKVLRYEPGRSMPMEHRFRASAAYGQPRTPKRTSSPDSTYAAQRGGGFQRPWSSWRGQEQPEDDGRNAPRPYSPFARPDPRLEDFARHPSADTAATATTEAIKTMGKLHEQTIQQLNKSRDAGPETFLKELLQQQTASNENKLAEESRRREQDRKDEEARHERRQAELDKAHQRELERIKAEADARAKAAGEERKMLMDIEERKRLLDREEHKNREEALRDELKRNREELKETLGRSDKEIKETRDAMAVQISDAEERAQQRFQDHQAALEREHVLKQKSLDTAEKFQTQIFDLKREAIQQAGGDQLFQIIGTAIKEFSKGLERIVDLKKIEALTPEAQAAAVANRTIDGNVMGEPRRQAAEASATAPQHAGKPGVQPEAPVTGSAGAPESQGESTTKEQQMEQIIQESLDRPFAKQLIKQWAVNIKRNGNPAMFANAYMEWMRDPMDHEGRKATSLFAEFMSNHTWEELLEIMIPKLDKETTALFRDPYAAQYYNGFSGMVCEQVREYWENFLSDRAAKRASATAAASGGNAPAVPAPEAAPALEGGR